LKDGAAAGLVLVVLDRTARQKIDLAAENILDFLVKIKLIFRCRYEWRKRSSTC